MSCSEHNDGSVGLSAWLPPLHLVPMTIPHFSSHWLYPHDFLETCCVGKKIQGDRDVSPKALGPLAAIPISSMPAKPRADPEVCSPTCPVWSLIPPTLHSYVLGDLNYRFKFPWGSRKMQPVFSSCCVWYCFWYRFVQVVFFFFFLLNAGKNVLCIRWNGLGG